MLFVIFVGKFNLTFIFSSTERYLSVELVQPSCVQIYGIEESERRAPSLCPDLHSFHKLGQDAIPVQSILPSNVGMGDFGI